MQNGQERKPDLVCSLEKEGFLGSFYQGDRYVDKADIFVGGRRAPRLPPAPPAPELTVKW